MFKVRQPILEEVPNFRDQGTLYSFIYPAQNKEVLDKLAAKKMTGLPPKRLQRLMAA